MKTLNKIIIGVFAFSLLSFDVAGQSRYGIIKYDVHINLSKRFSQKGTSAPSQYAGSRGGRGGGRTGFTNGGNYNRKNTANYLDETVTLYFNDSVSVFVTTPADANQQNNTFTTITRMNFLNRTIETKINLLGDEFYIQDTIPSHEWKFSGKIRTIDGIDCKQAVTKLSDGTLIYGWFNTDVLPSVGPESYADLPGAIMGLAYEDGSVTYFATDFSTEFPGNINAKFPDLKPKKVYTRASIIADFSTKYKPTDRLYQLVMDLLHFF